MEKLTKFDVVLHLSCKDIIFKDLLNQIRNNVFFAETSERMLNGLLRSLKKDNIVSKNKTTFSLNFENKKTIDMLAFLLWCKKDSIDYNVPMEKKTEAVFKKIFEDATVNLLKNPMFSRPTMFKVLKNLERIGFILVEKRKPFTVKPSINDKTILFANIFGYSFKNFEKTFDKKFPKKLSDKLNASLVKLHVYSTTVTEGNTATEEDVERVINNFSTGLSPKEVLEIVNAKKAIEELYKIKENVSIGLIKRLHLILMSNLVENPGEFSYIRKKVIGSPVRFPTSKIEIDISIEAMTNFCKKYEDKISPLLLAPIIHFVFVSIHPFIDGNGRVARLLHSLVLLRSGFPIFAFDPDYRNTYFSLLDKARSESIEDFVKFCIEKHKELIENL